MTDKQTPDPLAAANRQKQIVRLVIAVIAISLVVVLLFSALIGVGIYLFYQKLSAPVGTIKQQLQAINDGKLEDAYRKYTSSAFKKKTSFEDFSNLVNSNPQIFKSKASSFNQVNIENDQATVSGTVTGQDGSVTPMTYNLVFEKEKWLILGFRQGADSSR